MHKTILFDLDGTLLPMDTEEFLRHYLKAVAAYGSSLLPPDGLLAELMASTMIMVGNTDPTLTNEQVFAASFYPKFEQEAAELTPFFDRFYREEFPKLKVACPGTPGIARQVVQAVVDQGYEIVLATNPLFPRLAVEERMRWVGVDDLPWRLITTYEEMHATKPHAAYYQEILAKIGRAAEECLMVGNDVDEDGAAAQAGIKVLFVTDFLVNPSGRELPREHACTLAELPGRLPVRA